MTGTPRPELVGFQAAVPGFRAGRDTPRDFLERSLERLQRWEPALQAFAALDLAAARAAADDATRRWRSGQPLSTVDGMPVGIKDVIGTADLPTGLGIGVLADHRPPVDAAATAGLRRAGAVVVGKTATTEFAMTHPAPTRNPHDLDRTPGGSSSGSAAATGAGIIPAALGTQAIGSILRPSSFCGVFGYKPSVGSINRGGSHDTQSQSVIGVLAASLPDLWCTAWEIAARVGGDPGAAGLTGDMRPTPATAPSAVVHLETDGWAAVSDVAGERFARTLDTVARAGVRIRHRRNDPAVAELELALRGALDRARTLINIESLWPLEQIAARYPGSLSETLTERMQTAAAVGRDGYRSLLEWRRTARTAYTKAIGEGDLAVTLAAPGPAPRGLAATGDAALTVAATVLGAPALSLPVYEQDGMPVGLQVIGRRDHDAALFGMADWLRQRA
ncbi:amidase family protein [Pseudonocardia endophytica]|uniref:Asp-tRNA(Asn)/Glu-tRNA(Gln) amidotransferase A subunit family amidase n=1 Tax=Pseudonocardia endophytica TaxID=401976 RepID=A0A4R1HLC9_PSEEN|nr:amidase [Pseudonocardia endophytica]TCK21823.1 Asp-tRNA(Asn)/Glu-tRNA(Gln) amidotransferase A subunit family amidase [Pseudonocardia endophytica]